MNGAYAETMLRSSFKPVKESNVLPFKSHFEKDITAFGFFFYLSLAEYIKPFSIPKERLLLKGEEPMMNIPMHRMKYTKLTEKQIGEKLNTALDGPACVSEFSDILSGRSYKIVTKDGPVLEYHFNSGNSLTLSENGSSKIKTKYGALTLKQIIFFSHMIPETQKGYNVFIDPETDLATVIEVWFSSGRKEKTRYEKTITVDDREVQRQIYFGYLDIPGKKAPEDLHHPTNRIEGKGMYWKQDTGIETIELYASVMSTNFVELTRHADNLCYCSPSDYVLINDSMFIYDRTECEFSGIFTLFAADLFSGTQAGVRLGFNENDDLEYYMFRGTGKVVGHLAYLESFDNHGYTPMAGFSNEGGYKSTHPAPEKGQRYAYRPLKDFKYMTDEEVHKAALKSTVSFGGDVDENLKLMSGDQHNMQYTDMLAGREFTLRYDNGGPVRHYKVTDRYILKYMEEGENRWHEEPYRAYEADEKLIFFSHMLTDSKPRASVQVALDLTNGLTTCIHSQMGSKYFGNETTYYALFGAAEMEGVKPPVYMRHHYTDELVGQAFSWTYTDQVTAMHLYTTPRSAAWTIYVDDQALGPQWSAPCIFVKIREDVYIYATNEEACNGNELIFMINKKISHDCGFSFNGREEGVKLNTKGAIARHIGHYNIREYFGPKADRKGV